VEEDDALVLAAYVGDSGRVERLREAFCSVDVEPVADDWADRWREFHRPVRVGSLWIGPPWESAPADALAVTIDPGRAFGTGAHATTRLCLELLLDLPRGSLADLGCGSGVLAIAAAGLGFAPVLALDTDPHAVDATVANAARNGAAVEASLGDALADPVPACDVLVANIERSVVETLARRARARHLVLSGYLESDELHLGSYARVRRLVADGWAADRLVRAP
jgi:ribosomal protein L11 methyltransferase